MNLQSCIIQVVDLDAEAEAIAIEAARRLGATCLRRPSIDVALLVDPGVVSCIVAPLPSCDAVGYVMDSAARCESTSAVVFLARQPSLPNVVEAMRVGADDVVSWPVSAEILEAAMQRGLAVSSTREARAEERRAARVRLSHLSNGERDVLDLMLEGRVNKVVASRLNIAVRTVENRRKQIFTKLGTRSLAEIVRLVQLSGERPFGGSATRPSAVPAPMGLLGPRMTTSNRVAV